MEDLIARILGYALGWAIAALVSGVVIMILITPLVIIANRQALWNWMNGRGYRDFVPSTAHAAKPRGNHSMSGQSNAKLDASPALEAGKGQVILARPTGAIVEQNQSRPASSSAASVPASVSPQEERRRRWQQERRRIASESIRRY